MPITVNGTVQLLSTKNLYSILVLPAQKFPRNWVTQRFVNAVLRIFSLGWKVGDGERGEWVVTSEGGRGVPGGRRTGRENRASDILSWGLGGTMIV